MNMFPYSNLWNENILNQYQKPVGTQIYEKIGTYSYIFQQSWIDLYVSRMGF